MSELKATTIYDAYWKANSVGEGTGILVYLKSEADKVIAEKDEEIYNIKYSRDEWAKACNQKDKEIAELKKKLEDVQASAYAESVDAGMRERRLRRLLWHAIALFCARSCEYFSGIMSHCLMGQKDLYERCEEKKNKYLHAMYKCRAKMEEYK